MPMRCLRALSVLAGVALSFFAVAQPSSVSAFAGDLHWRLLGPFRGGWSTMAAGIPDRPNVFYFVGAGSGVWKTDNAGRTWESLGDTLPASAMGALAIAPSDPNVIYIGSGQVAARWDIQSGNGVYKSVNGGRTWQHMGLADTKYIGRILVDPENPDTVLVGALGHYFGPNHERGVFRSTDGGKTWKQTLAIDDDTGVVDLARDPQRPRVVFAAAWQVRNYPWLSYFKPNASPGSGIYKSSDDGVTWHRLTGNGLPAGNLARIGLATGKGGRVYAVINAVKKGESGLYRSDDDGAHWTHVSSAGWLPNDYFARITADPADPDVVYAAGQSIRKSTDGGKTWHVFKGAPGGDDYHFVWINLLHPDHMIAAVDQGTTVTVDGGRMWSSWYNQPTAQVYHLAADDQFPYWVYSGQQDSGTIGIASRSDYGAISYRDWHPVGGDERDYDVPDPNDPMIVYGSGLGGRISRFDARTGQVANVSPWPIMTYGAKPDTVKYRYTWITPLLAIKDRSGGTELLFGAQVLFRSTDRGDHWQVISPDLTGQKKDAQGCGKVSVANARACGYGVIYSIAVAPNDPDEIWTGSDSGMIHFTRDGGAHWNDVTPKGIATMTKISSLDVSAQDPCTVYAAADNHRDNDYAPHVWRTHDCGKTWSEAVSGLPGDHHVSVVRADPVRKGLLYAGTDRGVYVSFDDGGDWQPLQLNLPTAWVRDLLVHGNDLIAATQGRAIWVLDDLSPLRQWNANVARADVYLFKPAGAVRVHPDNNKDTPLPPGTPLGENPPAGAIIDYWLGPHTKGPVVVEIFDEHGMFVRSYDPSDEKYGRPHAFRYFDKDWWTKPPVNPPATPGLHRFVWDLHYTRPNSPSYDYSIAAVFGKDTPIVPRGPFVLPGRYRVVLKADGKTLSQFVMVTMDPRVRTSKTDLQAALKFSHQVDNSLIETAMGAAQQKAVAEQLDKLAAKLANDKAHASLLVDVKTVQAKLQPPENAKIDDVADFDAVGGTLAGVESDMESADVAPNQGQREVLASCDARLQRAQTNWQSLQKNELEKLDADLKAAGMPAIIVPIPNDLVMPAQAGGGADLP